MSVMHACYVFERDEMYLK